MMCRKDTKQTVTVKIKEENAVTIISDPPGASPKMTAALFAHEDLEGLKDSRSHKG